MNHGHWEWLSKQKTASLHSALPDCFALTFRLFSVEKLYAFIGMICTGATSKLYATIVNFNLTYYFNSIFLQ